MSQVRTQADSFDLIWSQHASKVLQPGCVLDNHFTLEQLSNVWILSVHRTTGIFLQECSALRQRRETSCMSILHLKHWENKGFVRQLVFSKENCRKPHDAEVHVFSDSVWCMGKGAMSEPEVRFTWRWNDYLEQYRESAKRVSWWIPDSVRVPHFLAGQGQGEDGQTPTPETYPHRVLFMGMLNGIPIFQRNRQEVKAPFLQDAERNADFFGNFKPGCFMYIGPGSELWEKDPDDPKGKWDGLAQQVTDVYLVQMRIILKGFNNFQQGESNQAGWKCTSGSVIHLKRWWWISSVQPTTSVSFSEFVVVLER